MVVLLAGAVLWLMPSRQISSAQDNKPVGPLIARGFTDAPAGSVTVGGDLTNGGGVLIELRVVDGQHVKKGEIIGVLSNYGVSAATVSIDEAELAKAETQRQAMMSGFRVTEIAAQEAVVRSSANGAIGLRFTRLQRSDERRIRQLIDVWLAELLPSSR